MKITKEQYDYYCGISTDRCCNKRKSTLISTSAIDPESLKEGDRVYVFPTCEIKKLPLRKFIKAKGAKQVFKPGNANKLITPKDLDVASRVRYKIPKGVYTYTDHPGKIYQTIEYDDYKNGWAASRLIKECFLTEEERGSYYNNNVRVEEELMKFDTLRVLESNRTSIQESHLKAIINPKVDFINETDAQQAVFDWEKKNNIRKEIDPEDWRAFQLLMENKDTWEVGMQILDKMNYENVKSKVLLIYYCNKYPPKCREKIFTRMLFRDPSLAQYISRPTRWFIHYTGDITLLRSVINVFNTLNLPIILKDINNIFSINVTASNPSDFNTYIFNDIP